MAVTASPLPVRQLLALLLGLTFVGFLIAIGYMAALLTDGSLPGVLVKYFGVMGLGVLTFNPAAAWLVLRPLRRLAVARRGV